MKIIPAIDLLDHQVVRLSQGDYNKVKLYSNNPLEVAHNFVENGLSRLHIVDLSGAKDEKPIHIPLIQNIKKTTNCQIEMGGGIRTHAQVKHLFDTCLDQKNDYVMLGSLPFKGRKEFEKIIGDYAKSILLTLDVWGEMIKISGWRESSNENLFSYIPKIIEEFALDSFLVTQIKSDGLLIGPDISLYKRILHENPNIKLIASGGVSNLDNIKSLAKETKVDGVIVGKAIYEKKIRLDEISAFNSNFHE